MAKNTEDLSAQLLTVVSEAEKATGKIADPELRRVAFDRVLQHLLQTGVPEVEKPKGTKQRVAKGKVEESNKPGPKTWLRELVGEGFFEEPKTSKAILQALEKKKHMLKQTDLTAPLAGLVDEKVLRRKEMSPEEGERGRVRWCNW